MTSTAASFLPPPRNISNAVETSREFDDFKDKKNSTAFAIEWTRCVQIAYTNVKDGIGNRCTREKKTKVYRPRVTNYNWHKTIQIYIYIYFELILFLRIPIFLFQLFWLKATPFRFEKLSPNFYILAEISRNFARWGTRKELSGLAISTRLLCVCVYLEARSVKRVAQENVCIHDRH